MKPYPRQLPPINREKREEYMQKEEDTEQNLFQNQRKKQSSRRSRNILFEDKADMEKIEVPQLDKINEYREGLNGKNLLFHSNKGEKQILGDDVGRDIQNQQKKKQREISENLKGNEYQTIVIFLFMVFGIAAVIIVICYSFIKIQKPSVFTKNKIIERNFTENTVYELNYTIQTQIQNLTMRMNYTTFYAVKGATQNQTQFTGVLIKRSEEKFDKDGKLQNLQLYDESDMYKKIFQSGLSNLEGNEDQSNTTDLTHIDSNYAQYAGKIKKFKPILPVFQFSIAENGTILEYTFPKDLDSETVSLMNSFVKLFSPLLSTKLYSENKIVKKIQNTNESSHEENKQYDYHHEEGTTILDKNSSKKSNDSTQNSNQTTKQSSKFRNDGQLQEAHLQANSSFNSIPEPPSDNYSTFSFNLSFTSQQNATLKLVEKFTTKKQYIKEFEHFLAEYKHENATVSLTVDQIVDFVRGITESDDDIAPGKERLLLEEDGSLSLIKYDKEVTILKTNIIGFKIGVFGYFKLNLKLFQSPDNPNKKNPKFSADVGSIVQVGFKKMDVPILDYEKNLPPLTLKYTLTQIEGAIDLLKSGFIKEVISLSKAIMNGDFENNLLPNIMKVAEMVENVTDVVRGEQNKNAPNSTMDKIFSLASDLNEIIDTKGMDLLNPKNQLAKNISNELLSFVNISYADALKLFNKVKGDLEQIKDFTSYFFQDSVEDYKNMKIKQILKVIKNLVPPDVQASYEKQIEKAKAILNYIDYVRDQGLEYKETLEKLYTSDREDLMDFINSTMELFFHNQSSVVNPVLEKIQTRIQEVSNEVEGFQNETIDIDSMDTKILNLFNTLYFSSLDTDSYMTQMTAILDSMASYAEGINREKGSCCHWHRSWKHLWMKKTCSSWNSAQSGQAAQKAYFSGMRNLVESQFKQMAVSVETFMQSVPEIVNGNKTIPDKFTDLKISYAKIIDVGLPNVTQAIITRRDAAQAVRNRVGCGGTSNFNSYLSKMAQLLTLVQNYESLYDSFSSQYNQVESSFDPNAYSQIVNNFNVIPQVSKFLTSYKDYDHRSEQLINNLNGVVKSFSADNFMANFSNFNGGLGTMYEKIGNSLDQLCQMKDSQKQQIDQMRKQYSDKLDEAKKLPSSFLDTQVEQFKQFLQKGSSSLFSVYEKIPFCEIASGYRELINKLPPQIKKFPIFFQIYNKFEGFWKNSKEKVEQLKEKFTNLRSVFFNLFDSKGYHNFMDSTENIASDLESVVQNISLEISNLKEESQSASVFQFSGTDSIKSAITKFTGAQFPLSSFDMFNDLKKLKAEGNKVIDLISYDILAVVVSAKDIKDYVNSTISNLDVGAEQLKGEFTDLCQSFIDLGDGTTQDYLNNINTKFRNILKIVNSTLFPNITEKKEQIQGKFNNFQFKNPSMKEIVHKSLNALGKFYSITHQSKQYMFAKVEQYSQKAIKLIDKLEIGSLNEVYQLGKFIKNKFSEFIDQFPNSVKKVLDFKNDVLEDFSKLFQFNKFFDAIKGQIKETYQTTIGQIKNKFTKTKSELEHNSNFYKKLVNQNFYDSLSNLESRLSLNFDDFFSSADETSSHIENLIETLTGDAGTIMNSLSSIKNALKDAKSNVTSRVQNIKQEWGNVKQKFFNLKSLIFISLKGQFGQSVMKSLHYIMKQIDDIVDIDLASIQKVTKNKLPKKLEFISDIIQKAIDQYNSLKIIRDKYIKKLQNGLTKLDETIKSKLWSKMDKLKQGQLFIKSQTNLQQPDESFELYHKTLLNYNAPIMPKIEQPIPTPIGVFYISIELNYTLGIQAKVTLESYRDIRISANFSASLVAEVQFYYGITYILEFGLFARGNVLRGQIEPAFYLQGVLPIQLVNAIADVEQISDKNEVDVFLTIDLGLYALEMDVGFYIQHIWIKLIWVDIRICIPLIFTKFCFSFKIPIGFTFTTKRHDWDWKIKGLPILKKRILDRKLLSFKI